MSQEELNKQYAIASALVKSWPAWKQNILTLSESPTVAVPRPPVDNSRTANSPCKRSCAS